MENWYFAVWGYNGFTGPGANRSNHPLDPIYGSWPRTPYSCGPTGDGKGHNRANYPYQELVFGCAANPPVVDGKPLWQAQADHPAGPQRRRLSQDALKLANFVFPYSKMDIPTPQPFHIDTTTPPATSPCATRSSARRRWPSASLRQARHSLRSTGSTVELVDIFNTGTGVLAWYAVPPCPG